MPTLTGRQMRMRRRSVVARLARYVFVGDLKVFLSHEHTVLLTISSNIKLLDHVIKRTTFDHIFCLIKHLLWESGIKTTFYYSKADTNNILVFGRSGDCLGMGPGS
jgi:hypothetical protein